MIWNYLEPLDRKWIWDDLGIGSIGIYRGCRGILGYIGFRRDLSLGFKVWGLEATRHLGASQN